MAQTLVDIKTKMDKAQSNNNYDNDDEEDHKATAQEKKQAEEAQDANDSDDSDDDGRMKKKQKKESFSLGCEILCQHIKFDCGRPSYIDITKLVSEVQAAHQ